MRYNIKLQFTVTINCKVFIFYLLFKAIYIKKNPNCLKKSYAKLKNDVFNKS